MYYKHLTQVCMTYTEHLKFSLSLSGKFAVGSYRAFVHALVPNLYTTSSSDVISDVAYHMSTHGCASTNGAHSKDNGDVERPTPPISTAAK